jgi:cytochrome P450
VLRTLAFMQASPRHALDAVTHPDPYPWYAQLRERAPLSFDASLNLWVATDAATVEAAFNHPQLGVRPVAEPVPRALVGTPAGEVFRLLVRMNDGDFHRRHKPDVAAAAQRWPLQQATQAGAAAAQDLLDRVTANELLSALPVRSMALLLGVPVQALDDTTRWVAHFTQGIAAGADAQAIARASEAAQQLMAQGEAQGLDKVRAANRIALMQQALDATAGLIGNTVLALQHEPALQEHDAQALVAEVVRWDAPVQNTRRFAAQDLMLAGHYIAQGQGVLLLLASANRDAALNAEPDRLWPGRPQRRSMGFGAGAHACPGEMLAIAMVAGGLPFLVAGTRLSTYFGAPVGYRPLPNARIPLFKH